MWLRRAVLSLAAVVTFTALGVLAILASSDLIATKFSSTISPINVDASVLKSSNLPDNFVEVVTEQDNGEPLNILLIGSDSRSGDNSQYGNPLFFPDARSDTTMIIHLSGDRTRATILSIPRDVLVPIPNCLKSSPPIPTPTKTNSPTMNENATPDMVPFNNVGNLERFNSAYTQGGADCVMKTLNQLTGIPISHVVEVDFSGFKKVIDAVGGVTVCLTEPINDPYAEVSLPAGEYKVWGSDALGLARARYTISDGSDTMRIGRQQLLVETLISESRTNGTFTDPKKVYNVANEILKAVKTDEKLRNPATLTSLALKAKNVPLSNVTFLTLPTTPNEDGATVSVNEKEAKLMFSTIIQDLPATAVNTSPNSDQNTNAGTSATLSNYEESLNTNSEPDISPPKTTSGSGNQMGTDNSSDSTAVNSPCRNVPPFN